MFGFTTMKAIVKNAFTGRALKSGLACMGLVSPVNVTAMYLAGESAEYIVAAALAVSQIGE